VTARHTINDNQWVRITPGTHSANTDLGRLVAGSSVQAANRQSRNLTLQPTTYIRNWSVFQVFAGNRTHGTGQIDLLLRTITDHDYFFQIPGDSIQGNRKFGLRIIYQFARRMADIRSHQNIAFLQSR